MSEVLYGIKLVLTLVFIHMGWFSRLDSLLGIINAHNDVTSMESEVIV